MYRLGVLGLTAAGHAAFALGVGRRGMDELTRIVQTKHRLGADPLPRPAAVPPRLRDARRRAARGARVRVRVVRDRAGRARGGRRLPHCCSGNGCARRRPTRRASPPTRCASPTPRPGPTRSRPERAAAVLPRPPRRDAAPRGRQQHAHRDDPGAARARATDVRDLEGKTAVVTGAGERDRAQPGAARLAAEGMRVVLADVEPTRRRTATRSAGSVATRSRSRPT